eukprot:jgi/Mesen1/541/ME001041S10740
MYKRGGEVEVEPQRQVSTSVLVRDIPLGDSWPRDVPSEIRHGGDGIEAPLLASSSESNAECTEEITLIPKREKLQLRRGLTLVDGINFVVSCIVGSGIFVSPGVVLQDVGSAGLAVGAWVAGGAVALVFCLVYAELGASMPSAGGDAEFLKMAYGDGTTAAFVWTLFFVFRPAGACIQSVAFTHYFSAPLLGLDVRSHTFDSDFRVKLVAVAFIALLTLVNCLGLHVGAWVQRWAIYCKVLLMGLLLLAGVAYVSRDRAVMWHNLDHPFEGSQWGGVGPAMVAALYAFEGWGKVVYLGEELQQPGRDMPRSAILGLLLAIALYVSVNLVYFCVLPVAGVKASPVVAVDVAEAALGKWAGTAVALLVAVSVAGNLNGNLFTGGRYIVLALVKKTTFRV